MLSVFYFRCFAAGEGLTLVTSGVRPSLDGLDGQLWSKLFKPDVFGFRFFRVPRYR